MTNTQTQQTEHQARKHKPHQPSNDRIGPTSVIEIRPHDLKL